jgi:transposase-like protein
MADYPKDLLAFRD